MPPFKSAPEEIQNKSCLLSIGLTKIINENEHSVIWFILASEACSEVWHKGHMPLMNQIKRGICPLYLNLPLIKLKIVSFCSLWKKDTGGRLLSRGMTKIINECIKYILHSALWFISGIPVHPNPYYQMHCW